MSMEIIMPKTGLTNTENTLDKWLVKEGEAIKKGQVIAEIESEKTTMPFESPADGIIHLTAKEGETVSVGNQIAVAADDEAEYAAICSGSGSKAAVSSGEQEKTSQAAQENNSPALKAEEIPAEAVVMPKTGLTNTENTLDKWLVKEGDTISKGQVIAEIESEKTTMPFESKGSGIIHLIAAEGDTVAVGNPIAFLAENNDAYEAIKKSGTGAAKNTVSSALASDRQQASDTEKTAGAVPAAEQAEKNRSGRVYASPLARKLAQKAGVDLGLVKGSGPKGRIVAKDIEAYTSQKAAELPASAPAERAVREPVRIPLTPIRRAIAKNMFNSLHSMAQTSDSVEIDVTELTAMRNRLKNKEKQLGTKITMNDMLSYAAVKMLRSHPLANASYTDTEIIQYPNVNLSMAVATNYGLVSPVLKDADTMSLVELSRGLKDLVDRARDRKLTAADQTGATFTITNMGVFPVDNFNPILPSPQSCIMGFGRCTEKPAVYNGEICIRTMMVLSITYDHRVFDGGELGSIMTTMKEYLENPELFLVQ